MPRPSMGRISIAGRSTPHGKKLYYVFAKDRAAYMNVSKTPAGPGQVIVKEAWKPVVVQDATREGQIEDAEPIWKPMGDGKGYLTGTIAESYFPYATRNGKFYRAGEPAGLYVMMRLAPDTPGTDAGWVYGTISPEGTVTASGQIFSCMSCHLEAPHGRLFGLPGSGLEYRHSFRTLRSLPGERPAPSGR